MWLLCGCDDRYARALAVTLHSTLSQTATDRAVNLVIVDNGLTTDSRSRLNRVVSRSRPDTHVVWAQATDLEMSDLLGARHISPSTYLRLFVEQLLPRSTERVLYLDSDLLVRDDVTALHDSDLQGRTVGAVRDMVIATVGHPYSGVVDHRELGLPNHSPYFNAGVLVIDVHRWRERSYTAAVLEYARRARGQGNFDQDALNAVLHDDWHELDLGWNVQGSLLLLHEHPPDSWVGEMASKRVATLKDPGIVHFSGTIKPWQPSSAHPFAAEWRRALGRSGWYSAAEMVTWAVPFTAKRTAVRLLVATSRRSARERAT